MWIRELMTGMFDHSSLYVYRYDAKKMEALFGEELNGQITAHAECLMGELYRELVWRT